jgi:hypothetical protein
MNTTFNINLNKTKTLLAGPWVGELGWELFCWQGYVRKLSREYNKTIIISRTGQDFLYEDFASEFYAFDSPTSEANMWDGAINVYNANQLIRSIKFDKRVIPFNIGYGYDENNSAAIIYQDFNKQEFIKYKSDTIDKHYDIIIHPRNKIVGKDRNWDANNWQKLIDLLKKDYSIAIIGNNEAHKLNGADDYRNISIRYTISLLNRTKLAIGQSSGPLHLASLCGTPHLVWSHESNKLRYLEHWNPFKTPVFFYSEMSWNPTVDFIYDKIIEKMK